MRGRPPKKALTPEQERAASAFVGGAETGASGSGQAEPTSAPVVAAPPPQRAVELSSGAYPWEAAYVREDVMKGYALRLPEPLYLKLKWVAEQTGRSINTVCREAIEEEVARQLGQM